MPSHADDFLLVFLVVALLFCLGRFGFFATALALVLVRSDSFLPNASSQLLAYSFVAPTRLMLTGLLLVDSSTKTKGREFPAAHIAAESEKGADALPKGQPPFSDKG